VKAEVEKPVIYDRPGKGGTKPLTYFKAVHKVEKVGGLNLPVPSIASTKAGAAF
jgi:hypothetical protein